MFQWYILAMFGIAIPRSMVINMSLSTRGVTHWWIVSRWSQKNMVTDDMVQIHKKKQVPNVLFEKCWDGFKRKFKEQHPQQLSWNKQKIHPILKFWSPSPPVAQKGNTFLIFPRHWESTCWIHFEPTRTSSTTVFALFFVGRQLGQF